MSYLEPAKPLTLHDIARMRVAGEKIAVLTCYDASFAALLERCGVEVLLVLKTTAARIPALEKLIITGHPYDTPEFIVLSINRGNQRYLAWLEDSVA